MTRRWQALAASAAVYLVVTSIFGRDVLADIAGTIVNDEGDPVFVSSILYWNATRLPLLDGWWQFPIFQPTRDTLAFSEHFLGLSVIASPIYWLTRNAIVTYNVVTLLTFPLCGVTMYALVFRLTRNARAAFVAGLAFAFAPYRMSQLPHLQMLAFFWAPIALLGLHAYVETHRRRWLVVYGGAWLLQAASNGYALVFFSVFVALWVVWFVIARRDWRGLVDITVATLLAALPLAPILIPYVRVHALHGFSRDPQEIELFGADLFAVFCAPGQLTLWKWLRVSCRPEGELFPGVATVALALVGLFLLVKQPDGLKPPPRLLTALQRLLLAVGVSYAALTCFVIVSGPVRYDVGGLHISASSMTKPAMIAIFTSLFGLLLSPRFRAAARTTSLPGFYLVAALLTWALALGPRVIFMGDVRNIPGPFALLTYLPAMNSLRVPARFWVTTTLCVAVLGGFTADALLRGRRRVVAGALMAAMTALILADGWAHIAAAPIPQRLPDARLLQNALVLQLPMGVLRDIATGYRAVIGGWRSVNGYSGYEPHYYSALLDAARAEEPAAVVPFRAFEDLHVVIAGDAERLRAMIEAQPGAVVTARGADAVQYKLPRMPLPRDLLPEIGERRRVQSLSASSPGALVGRMLDGDTNTFWDFGPPGQRQELHVSLEETVTVGVVVLDLGKHVGEFPRHLVIETSVDGTAWQPAWNGSVRTHLIAQALQRPTFPVRVAVPFTRRPARHVRLQQISRDGGSHWVVAEIEIWSGGRD